MHAIDPVFDLLDRWRHLPAYQLERRADVYFALYLPEVLEAVTGTPIDPRLVPELPIKRDLIWRDSPSNLSVKVDYAAFAADRSKVFLVELKTDDGSRNAIQDHYLETAAALGLAPILEGVVAVARKSTAHGKYAHLLALLAEHGCLKLPDGLLAKAHSDHRQGLRKLQVQVEVTVAPGEWATEVIYVQPNGAGEGCIDFERFATVVEKRGDPLSQRFARSLRTWATERAGRG
ncbi:MAG: hypothetical protein H6704_31575 [Myxococcales bacterium]|nr:hypothetical protein [Myxococcales bacterium]